MSIQDLWNKLVGKTEPAQSSPPPDAPEKKDNVLLGFVRGIPGWIDGHASGLTETFFGSFDGFFSLLMVGLLAPGFVNLFKTASGIGKDNGLPEFANDPCPRKYTPEEMQDLERKLTPAGVEKLHAAFGLPASATMDCELMKRIKQGIAAENTPSWFLRKLSWQLMPRDGTTVDSNTLSGLGELAKRYPQQFDIPGVTDTIKEFVAEHPAPAAAPRQPVPMVKALPPQVKNAALEVAKHMPMTDQNALTVIPQPAAGGRAATV